MTNLPEKLQQPEIILYQTEDGKTKIEVRVEGFSLIVPPKPEQKRIVVMILKSNSSIDKCEKERVKLKKSNPASKTICLPAGFAFWKPS